MFRIALSTLAIVLCLAFGATVSQAEPMRSSGRLFDHDRSAPLGVVTGNSTTSQGIVREEFSYLAG